MNFLEDFKKNIFTINEHNFDDSSLKAFDFQYNNNTIYRQYCDALKKSPKNVENIHSIPFLPIEFFKNRVVKSTSIQTKKIFKSSGTTGTARSNHYISDLDFYHEVCARIFEKAFGPMENLKIIALLPSYIEQGDSSLISMVDYFIKKAKSGSGYFLNKEIENELKQPGKKILFGVSYALLDAQISEKYEGITVVETGGMKGRKKEITRAELIQSIQERLQPQEIWSEYGMTELQSQAYGKTGFFRFPPWAKTLIREVNDPFTYVGINKTGGINVIDLANIESCSFIETKDLGKISANGLFEVLGRFDNSDIRGCNLLV